MENTNSKKTDLKLSADIFLKDISCISYSYYAIWFCCGSLLLLAFDIRIYTLVQLLC